MLNGHQGLFAPGCLPWRTRLYHPSKFARDSQLAPERFGFGLAASVLAVGPLLSLGVANATDFDGFWVQVLSSGSQPAFFVDDIRLTAVPEPSVPTLVAMIGGCGIWFAGWRRQQHFRTRQGSAG